MNTEILLSGGIGDILALESYFSNELRRNLTTLHLASRVNKQIQDLFQALPNYPNLKTYNVLYQDFSIIPCILHKCELHQLIDTFPENWEDVQDWSILSKFPPVQDSTILIQRLATKKLGALEQLLEAQKCIKEYLPKDVLSEYNESSFIKYKLCDISVDLPKDFIVIFPYTNTIGTPRDRNFTNQEWDNVLYHLTRNNIIGVILGQFDDYVPKCKQLINYNKKTSLLESIEITKVAKGYIGVDSFDSVIAGHLFEYPNLIVKSINPHCFRYSGVYYATQKNFDFLVREIKC